jgi:hypothetical protein
MKHEPDRQLKLGEAIMNDKGTLSICGEYEGDLDSIAEVLNGFEFDEDEGRARRFQVFDNSIEAVPSDPQGLNAAFPVCAWFSTKDGRRLPASKYGELRDEDVDEWEYEGCEDVSLAELSNAIAPLLKRGTLELVSTIHREAGFRQETLEIRSDGLVQRHKYDCETFQPEHAQEPCDAVEGEDASFNFGLAIKPTENETISNDQSDAGCATLTPLDPNGPKANVDRTMPDIGPIVPKTLDEYVADFKEYYVTSALAHHNSGFVGPILLPEMEARREVEMYRVTYEAYRSLDYWEFTEFWKEISLKRGAICMFVNIGKLYPSILRCIEGGKVTWRIAALMTQLPYSQWFERGFPRHYEEMWQETEHGNTRQSAGSFEVAS